MCFFDSDVNCPFNCPLVSDFHLEPGCRNFLWFSYNSTDEIHQQCWEVLGGEVRFVEVLDGVEVRVLWRSFIWVDTKLHAILWKSVTLQNYWYFYRIIKTTCRLKLSQRPSQDAWENICRHLVFRGGTSERWAAVIQQSMTIKKHFIVKRMHMIETEVQFLNRCQTTAATLCWWNDACSPTELVISVFCQRD